MLFYLFIYFIFIFYITNTLIKYTSPLMGKKFEDIPNERSSHKKTKLKVEEYFFIISILIVNIIDLIINGSSEISKIIFYSLFYLY